jgi:hypothetical protein
MTYDQALAQLAAARLRLFNASQHREAVMLRRVRVDGKAAFDAINAEIAAARADVAAATTAVQTANAGAPTPSPPTPSPPDPVQAARDTALDAVLAARAALSKLG